MNGVQRQAFRMSTAGPHNVFCTDPGGTGKTWLLRKVVEKLEAGRQRLEGIAMMSSTGLPAFDIGGVTLYSFSGVQTRDGPLETLEKMVPRRASRAKWIDTELFVLDEISSLIFSIICQR